MCCTSQRQSHCRDCWQDVGNHAHDDRDDNVDINNDNDDNDSSSNNNCQWHDVSNNCFDINNRQQYNVNNNCVDNKLDFNRFVFIASSENICFYCFKNDFCNVVFLDRSS